ncbi:hypothetical protein F5Y04DRAFT_275688 [Hypomontagnella monticulosa]|nr:hypothetical protein F5Y04DRAFT_275688 [Hypomontagnella monticulosa]
MAQITERNWVSSPLWNKIPIEIRLKIYELAVFVDPSVRPKQIGRRSNKFVWGKFEPVKSNNRLRLYDRDVVSSNTRKEFRAINQELGIVERLPPKYGADGELNWRFELHDVRWIDEGLTQRLGPMLPLSFKPTIPIRYTLDIHQPLPHLYQIPTTTKDPMKY